MKLNKHITPITKTNEDDNKVNLFKKFLPLDLLPEKYQIILFYKFPPSNDPMGIRFKKPRKIFNTATLLTIFMINCSLD